MGPVDSQKPPGLKSFPQQSQASSPLPVGSPSLQQFLRSDPFLENKAGGAIQRWGGQEATVPAFTQGRDCRDLRSVTGRHDLT